LNHLDPEGWQRALAAAKQRQAKIGPPPDGYAYAPPIATPPTDPRIKAVTHRATAYEPARVNPVVDRATRTKQRRQKMTTPKTPANFDWSAFLTHHWQDVFRHLWRTYRLDDQDIDGELGRVLAIAYRDKLDGQSARWDHVLRQLRQGLRPGQAADTPRQLQPIAPSPPSRLVCSPDNDAWLEELYQRVTEREREAERERGRS
jgi:hypothetical protein